MVGSIGQRQFQNANQATRQRPGGCEERLRKFYKKGKNCEPRQVPKTKFAPMELEVKEQEKGKGRSLLVVSTCNEIAVRYCVAPLYLLLATLP